jgi:hypothetical protein
MRRARICIVTRGDRPFDGSLVAHYAIRKYHEAMAAGCLLVGDLPDNKVQYACRVPRQQGSYAC